MEVKVFVDGLPRMVCGLTEMTTCQEVVIALAQALGRPGQYTLKEKFKDFERFMAPGESLLESIKKYGEQSREVQLTLLLNRAWERPALTKGNQNPPGPQLRRKEAVGTKMRRGRSSLSLHRQSLPALSRLCQEEAEPLQEVKRPKRRSVTLMEAWGWLENLGKGKLHYTVSGQENRERTGAHNLPGDSSGRCDDMEGPGQDGFLSRVRQQRNEKHRADRRTSCCMGNQTREEESQHFRKTLASGADAGAEGEGTRCLSGRGTIQDERDELRMKIMSQLSCLRDLHVQITWTERQIGELEARRRGRGAQRAAVAEEEEHEQLLFWENEMNAEEGYERTMQAQFLEMRERAAHCKNQLEEHKCRMQRLAFHDEARTFLGEEPTGIAGSGEVTEEISAVLNAVPGTQTRNPDGLVNTDRKDPPRESSRAPHAPVPHSQIKKRRPTGPRELREWWKRWSEAHCPPPPVAKQTVLHRSELTIYLGSTKV